MVKITAQTAADHLAVERLLDAAFGPKRHGRPSYRLRRGVEAVADLALAARHGDRLVGSLRFWPTVIGSGGVPALLLGPLAVDEAYRHRAIATDLLERGLKQASDGGHGCILAVGTSGLFGRFGFVPATPLGLVMDGLVDTDRLLIRLEGDAASCPPGSLKRARSGP